MTKFSDFPLHSSILNALEKAGFSNPTEIQEQAFQKLLTDKPTDFHGQAQTGTGKTLAFGIPLIQSIDAKSNVCQGLVVAPTRELVVQICQSLSIAARDTGVSIVPIYGGASIENQIKQLRKGAHIVVGTPGRLNDHLRRKTLKINDLKTLVLDEADIMLDMGFKEDVDVILSYAPQERQIWLFSATVKSGISDIKRTYMKDPVMVQVSAKQVSTANTKQFYCSVPQKNKFHALVRFIESNPEFYGIIFCRTKMLASDLAQDLIKKGYNAYALHGDINQTMRNKVIADFKARKFTILLATDVAARGIDIDSLTHVVNYCVPEDQESYIHRVGRTGRAGKEGTAITFVSGRDQYRIKSIARRFKIDIQELEVPSLDAITNVRLAKTADYISELCNKKIRPSSCTEKLSELLAQHSQEQLSQALHSLLYTSMLKMIDDQRNLSFTAQTTRERSDRRPSRPGEFYNDPNNKEIMVHLGAQDGITKNDILKYITGTRMITSDQIGKIRIIKKLSFVHLPSHVALPVMKKLNGQRLLGRKVRLNFAQR